MGTVANSNYGFKGTVSSAETPQVLGNGSLYSVEGKDDLKVTAGGTGDRAVTVAAAPNGAWGDAVLSKWTTGANLNCAANSTGVTRYDTVVIRRTWTPAGSPTGTATLMVLTGGSSVAIAAGRLTDRGITSSDQPIALVPVPNGSAVVGAPIDLRCWTGEGGGLVAEHVAALQYLGSKGTQVRIGPTLYTRLEDGTGGLYWATAGGETLRVGGRLQRSDGALVLNAGITDLRVEPASITALPAGAGTVWSGSGLAHDRPGLWWAQATLRTAAGGARWVQVSPAALKGDIVGLGSMSNDDTSSTGFGTATWSGFLYCPTGPGLRLSVNSNVGMTIRDSSSIDLVWIRP